MDLGHRSTVEEYKNHQIKIRIEDRITEWLIEASIRPNAIRRSQGSSLVLTNIFSKQNGALNYAIEMARRARIEIDTIEASNQEGCNF